MAKAPTKPETAAADAESPGITAPEAREFVVVSPIDHDGTLYGPGDDILLSRAAFLPLRDAGAVGGDWPEESEG